MHKFLNRYLEILEGSLHLKTITFNQQSLGFIEKSLNALGYRTNSTFLCRRTRSEAMRIYRLKEGQEFFFVSKSQLGDIWFQWLLFEVFSTIIVKMCVILTSLAEIYMDKFEMWFWKTSYWWLLVGMKNPGEKFSKVCINQNCSFLLYISCVFHLLGILRSSFN